MEMYVQGHLRTEVVDKGLRRKLTPTYPLVTKRILFDNCFYHALTRPNVQLVTESILSVGRNGIEINESTRPTDVIICATGFIASEFLVPMIVQGSNGRTLNEDWRSGAEAFMGLAIH